jgi:hypothetical protein
VPNTVLLGIARRVRTLVRSAVLITAVFRGQTPSAGGRALAAEVSMVAEASTVAAGATAAAVVIGSSGL